jgi:uncharacterized membrane protein
MPKVRYSVTINRPIGEVFRFATDPEKVQEWQKDVKKIYHPEESLRAGVILSHDRNTRLFTWRLDLNADIMDYRPNKLVVYQGALGRFNVQGRIEFDAVRRTTTVTEEVDIKMGCTMFMFSPFMTAVMKRRTQKALDTLKSVLEEKSAQAET